MSAKTLGVVPSSLTRLATGTYTGDGAATQAIAGVGFQPKFVWIYNQAAVTTTDLGYKTDQDGLNSMIINAATANTRYVADMIISLDADGFTVGDGTGVLNVLNIAAAVYTYICFG